MLIAALVRALVETEARAWRDGRAVLQPRTELLRLAAWRASRSGLDAALLNPVAGPPEQARIVVTMLLEHCRDALAEAGEADTVAELLTALLARGNGAAFQRAAYRRSGRLSDVIGAAVLVTESGYHPCRLAVDQRGAMRRRPPYRPRRGMPAFSIQRRIVTSV